MAEAVYGARALNSQSPSAAIPDPTRRALLSAIPAAAIGAAALAPAARAPCSAFAGARDEQFLAWEQAYLKAWDAYPAAGESEGDQLHEVWSKFRGLILLTPSASRVAALVKLRTIMHGNNVDIEDERDEALEHILAFLKAA